MTCGAGQQTFEGRVAEEGKVLADIEGIIVYNFERQLTVWRLALSPVRSP